MTVTNEAPCDRARRLLVVASIVIGLVIFAYGMWAHALYAQRQWSPRGLIAWVIVVGIAGTFGTVMAWGSAYWRQWVALLVVGYAVVAVGVGPVVGIGLLATAAFSLGALLLDDLLRARSEAWSAASAPGLAVRFTAGAACLIAVVQFAAHWPINHPGAYALILSAIVLGCRKRLVGAWSVVWSRASMSSFGEGLAAGLVTVGLALHVVVAAKPEIGHDALSMHLLIPGYVAEHMSWHFDVTRVVFAVVPLAGDWYFTLGYMLGGEFGVRLANLCLVLLAGLWLSALLDGQVDTVSRRVLLALYFSTPLLGLTSGSLFVEHLWSLMLLAAAGVAFSGGLSYGQRWVLAALLLAVAMTTKVIAVFALPVFAAVAVIQARSLAPEDRRRLGSTWLTAVLIIGIVGGWPYGVALVKTGNPVFPFMNALFQSPFYPAVSFDNPLWKQPLRPSTLYHVTFDSGKYLEARAGAAGFQWLIFVPAALIGTVLFRRWSLVGHWAVAGALIVGVFSQQSYLRYLEPAAAFLTLALAVLFSRELIGGRLVNGLAVTAGVVMLLNAFFFASSGWYHRNLVELDFARYVADSVPERPLIDVVNALDPNARTMFIDRYFAAGLKGPSVSNNWYFPALNRQLAEVRSEIGLAGVLLRNGIDYVIGLNEGYGRFGMRLAEPLSEFEVVASKGRATLVRLRPDVRYTEERLKNPDLKRGLEAWHASGAVALAEGGVRVTLSHNVSQVVAVSPGERYRVSLKVRCTDPAVVRLQVNWLTASGAFVGAFLVPKDCREEAELSEVAQVPAGASAGVYYLTSHDERPVDVLSASFRR